jgi:hypothetical protein
MLVTTHQNLRCQQKLQDRTISIVVLMTTSSPRIAKRTTQIAAMSGRHERPLKPLTALIMATTFSGGVPAWMLWHEQGM